MLTTSRRRFSSLACLLIVVIINSPKSVIAQNQWGWPIRPAVLIQGFSPPEKPWMPGHRGVDLRASVGQPVYSAGTGWVTFAGQVAGRGVVVIAHTIQTSTYSGVIRTTYEPLRPAVNVGDDVQTGDLIGHIAGGVSHCAIPRSTRCLHWGLRLSQPGQTFRYGNPLLLVGRVRLLPMPSQ